MIAGGKRLTIVLSVSASVSGMGVLRPSVQPQNAVGSATRDERRRIVPREIRKIRNEPNSDGNPMKLKRIFPMKTNRKEIQANAIVDSLADFLKGGKDASP
jgi:hypothetical protein